MESARNNSSVMSGSANPTALGFLGAVMLAGALSSGVAAQDSIPPGDSVSPGSSVPTVVASGGLPVFLTVGIGYGRRSDPCAYCTSPDNTDSFSGHVSLGRYLGHGIGVGVDASVWRRGHPGSPAAPDSAGVQAPTTLSNTLGNASFTFSYQIWHLFVRGGGGVAWGQQDLEDSDADGDPVVVRAKGLGIGYSVGGGITLPLAGAASVVFYGNWNVGRYDMMSPTGVLGRDVQHDYIELGMGLTIR